MLETLDRLRIHVWIDGGWGVDALTGKQTREHLDLDLAVDQHDLSRITQVLGHLGFRHDRTVEPGLPARLVLRDSRSRQIDVHPLVFDRTATAGNSSPSQATPGAVTRPNIYGQQEQSPVGRCAA